MHVLQTYLFGVSKLASTDEGLNVGERYSYLLTRSPRWLGSSSFGDEVAFVYGNFPNDAFQPRDPARSGTS